MDLTYRESTRLDILNGFHGIAEYTKFTVSATCILLFSYYDRRLLDIDPTILAKYVLETSRLLSGEYVENNPIVQRLLWNLKRRKIGNVAVMSALRETTKIQFLSTISDFVVSKI